MKYALVSPFLGEQYEHEISKGEYTSLLASHHFLREYMRFEETVLQAIYSFQEVEKLALETALEYYLFPLAEFNQLQDLRVRSNIKVLSFLNSITSLRDQFPTFKGTPSIAGLRDRFRLTWEREKEQSLEFAFSERLRNFAQHQTQPVSSVTTGGGWDDDRRLRESRVSIYVKVLEVSSERNIPANERKAYLEKFGEKVDLTLLFRSVMSSVGRITKEMRELSEAEFRKSVSEIEKAIRVASGYVDKFVACYLASIDEGEVKSTVNIFSDFVKRAESLRATYLNFNLEQHYISNRARGHSQPLVRR